MSVRRKRTIALLLILLNIIETDSKSGFREFFKYCSLYLTDGEFKGILSGVNKYFKDSEENVAWVQYELMQLYIEYI